MRKQDLDTPAIVVDLDQLERNLRTMQERVHSAGADLRPHIKTHKTPELARMQVELGARGITVAKLGEAEVMISAGMDDVFVANEIIGADKVDRLAALGRCARVRVCVDSLEGARMLSEGGERNDTTFEVLLDVNTGLDRTGVAPEEAVELGQRMASLPRINLVGVFSYAGYKPGVPDDAERRRWAEHEACTAVEVAQELCSRGIEAAEVSVAGTPCGVFAAAVPGVTEVRPGTYVFYDANYMRLGVCSLEECALRIRARVISRPAPDRAVLDAGSKVLTTEKKTTEGEDLGYGLIPEIPDTRIARLWEEHAVLELDEEGRQLRVGDAVEIIPNHVCPTVNLADRWFGVRGDEVEREYRIAARGRTS